MTARHVLANVAPAVLARLLGEPRARRPAARGRAAQAQHAALAAAAAARRRRSTRARRSRGRSTSTSPRRSSRSPTRRRSAGEVPELAPCEIYCHSLTDPSILGAGAARGGRADADLLRAAHAGAAVRAASHEEAKARGDRVDAAVAEQRARRADRGLPVDRRPSGEPCLEARTPVELEAELGAARRQHLPPRPARGRSPRTRPRWARGASRPRTPTCSLCGAGARRGGGVSGIPGHNAAMACSSI